MSINCSRCGGDLHILNGMMQGKQRYKCKYCGCNFTIGDGRKKYENKVKLLAVKMYLNNCGFRRISAILGVPLATCFFWIKKAGKIVDKAVKERESEDNKAVESIEVLEMDELYPKLDFY